MSLSMLQKYHQEMKLGKAPVKFDKRTLRLKTYIKAVTPPPLEMGYIDQVKEWPMMLNDSLGDCTVACAGHQIEQWTRYAQPPGFTPSDAQVLAAYEAVSGYSPNIPGSDQGAVVLNVLKYWRRRGIAGHKICAFASINVNDPKEFQQAITLFGNVYLGVGLPVSAQDPRTDENGLPIWEVQKEGPIGNGQPWSWGGHAIPGVGYKSNIVPNGGMRVVSWGQLYDVSWNFIRAYCDEAYAIVTQDWIEENQKSPSGFDINQLLADLNAL